MSETPREYDREFTTPETYWTRRRFGYDTDRGTVTRFVVQIECRLGDEWEVVVRLDHDPESEHGHDVAADGVHLDVYRDGEKLRSETLTPPMEPAAALTYAEEHLKEEGERYVDRFERWHETSNE